MIRLKKATWSHTASAALYGVNQEGERLTTPQLFWVTGDVYKGTNGLTYEVLSWAPDGRGYGDKKK